MRKLSTLVTTTALLLIGLVCSTDRANAQCQLENCPTDITVMLSIANPTGCDAFVSWSGPSLSATCPPHYSIIVSGPSAGSVFNLGSTGVTYQVIDNNGGGTVVGSIAPCNFNVIVIDDIAPIFDVDCPDDMVVAAEMGTCSAVVTWVEPASTADHCAPPLPTTMQFAGQTSGSTFQKGVSSVSYSVTDDSGNSTTCGFTITVEDATAAGLSCPNSVTIGTDGVVLSNGGVAPGLSFDAITTDCGASVTYDFTASDNCPEGSYFTYINGVASAETTFTFPVPPATTTETVNVGAIAKGVTTLAVDVIDCGGAISTCEFTITVEDNQPPTMTCPSDVTIGTDNSVIAQANPADAFDTTIGPIPGDCAAGIGFDFTLADNCPESTFNWLISYATPSGPVNTVGALTQNFIITPEGVTISWGKIGFPKGTCSNTFTLEDCGGNTINCSFTATIVDNEAPMTNICPPSVTIGTDGIPSGFGGDGIGAINTFALDGDNGCSAKYNWSNITFTDNCPEMTIEHTAAGAFMSTYPVTTYSAPGTPPAQALADMDNVDYPKGTTTETYIMTDCGGATASCSFTITVEDNEPPAFTLCPTDAVVYTDGTVVSGTNIFTAPNENGLDCAADISWSAPVVVDNCPEFTASAGIINSTNPISLFGNLNVGLSSPITTYQFGGPSNNMLPTVLVIDGTYPTSLDVPMILGYVGDHASSGEQFNVVAENGAVVFTSPQSSDCGPQLVNFTVSAAVWNDGAADGVTSFTLVPTGSDVDDFCANNFAAIGVGLSSGMPFTGTGNTSYAASLDPVTTYTFPKGVSTVIYIAQDCGGETAECSFTVTVEEDPSANAISFVNCPPSATVNTIGDFIFESGGTSIYKLANITGIDPASMDMTDCGVEIVWQDPIASDNCPEATLAYYYSSNGSPYGLVAQSSGPLQSNLYPVQSDGYAGIQDPAIAYGYQFYNGYGGNGEIYGKDGNVHAFRYTAEDCGGAVATCEFTVVVVDEQDPVFTFCPPSITLSNDAGLCSAVATWMAPVATDNCPEATVNGGISGSVSGSIYADAVLNGSPFVLDAITSWAVEKGTAVVTYELIDCGSGNTGIATPTVVATCEFSITVEDTEPPSITCPATVTFGTDGALLAGDGSAYTTYGGPGDCVAQLDYTHYMSDNCPEGTFRATKNTPGGSANISVRLAPAVVTYTRGGAQIDIDKGTVTWDYEVEDCGGNIATCQFSYTILDNESPATTFCPGDVTIGTNGIAMLGDTGSFGNNGDIATDCKASVSWASPVFTDNCPEGTLYYQRGSGPIVSASLSGSPFTAGTAMTNYVFPKGVTSVSYVLEDCGNANAIGTTTPATCKFTVTIEDNQAPTMDCPADVTLLGSSQSVNMNNDGTNIISAGINLGDCAADVTWANPVVTDNCPEGIYSMTSSFGGAGGSLTTFSSNPSLFSLGGEIQVTAPKGTSTVRYWMEDCGGNTIDCDFSITVIDDEDPAYVRCPADVTVGTSGAQLGGDFAGYTIVTNTLDCGAEISWAAPLATDNCPEGTVAEAYIFTDGCDDTANNSMGSWITTAEPPFFGTLNSEGTYGPGVLEVSYVFTDCGGMTDDCEFSVTILDDERPVETVYNCVDNGFVDVNARFYYDPILNPTGIINPDSSAFGQCGAYVTWLEPMWVDNCNPAMTGEVVVDPSITGVTHANGIGMARFGASENGTQSYQVTYNYKTNCNTLDSMYCTFNIQIGPDVSKPPIMNCPASATVDLDPGECFATVTWTRPISTDNCRLAAWEVNIDGAITTYDPLTAYTTSAIETITVTAGATVNITYTALDGANNVSYCQFSYTAKDDMVPPVFINCPFNGGTITVNTDPSDCDAFVTWAAVIATDNCTPTPLVNVTPNITSNDYSLGTNVQNFVATDAAGNTASCSFTVIVEDQTPPSLACPPSQTYSTANTCEDFVNYTTPTAADNCTPISVLPVITDYYACAPGLGWKDNLSGGPSPNLPGQGPVSGTIFPTGYANATTVEYTATDGSGNTTTCEFTITLIERNDPTIVCPADVTIGTSGAVIVSNAIIGSGNATTGVDGDCSARIDSDPFAEASDVTTTPATYSDACDFGWNPPGCGIAPISHTITDGGGTTKFGGRSMNDADINYLFEKGTSTVEVTVTDDSGNEDACSFTVTVVDDEMPSIVCPADVTVGTSGTVYAGAGTTWVVTDANGGTSVVGTAFNATSTGYNCEVSGSYNLLWEDNCPDSELDIISATATGPTPQVNPWGDRRVWTTTDWFSGTFDKGTHTESFIVEDCGGFTVDCSFDVTVIDDDQPQIVCPGDITLGTNGDVLAGGFGHIIITPGVNEGYDCAALTTFQVQALDNCPNFTLSSVQTLARGQDPAVSTSNVPFFKFYRGMYPKGTTTEIWQVEDCGDFTETCSFTVTVEDNEAPTIQCPPVTSVRNDVGECSAIITGITPKLDDNCPFDSSTDVRYWWCNADLGCDPGPGAGTFSAWGAADALEGTLFPVGQTDGQYQFIDCSGTIVTCDFRIIVNDEEYPTLTCPSDVTVTTSATTWIDGTNGELLGGLPPLLGNQNVPVVPIGASTPPGLWIDGMDGDCGALVSFEFPEFSDNCPYNTAIGGAPSLGYAYDYIRNLGVPDAFNPFFGNKESGDFFDKGDNDVAFYVLDQGSNLVICEFVVTVEDDENPFIACPADVTVGTSGSVLATTDPSKAAMFTPATGDDDCDVDATYLVRGWDNCPNAMINADAGNDGTGTNPFTITMGDLTVTTNSYAATFDKGDNTEMFIITDASGNENSCEFTVTIVDDEDPRITCPADMIVANDPGLCEAAVTVEAPQTFDNCAPACPIVITNDRTSVASANDVYPVGDTDVTFTVTDEAGNAADCTMTITVEDREDPVLTCPTDFTVTTSMGVDMMTGDCGALVTYDVVMGDNCGGILTRLHSTTTSPIAPWINEFHYDNAGGDVFEGFEIAGQAGTNLSGYSVVLYNGSGGAPYNTINLSGVIGNEGAGYGAIWFALPSNGMQNGGPDGLALVQGASVLEFLSYEGTMTANGGPANGMLSTDVGVSETSGTPLGQSLQLVGSGNDGSDFTWSGPASASPGSLNAGQSIISAAIVSGTGAGGTTTYVGGNQIFPYGNNWQAYSLEDAAGNAVSCEFVITIEDDEAPMITCPDDITDVAVIGECSRQVWYPDATATDNCPGDPVSPTPPAAVTVVQVLGDFSGAQFPVGTSLIRFRATDGSGNTSECDMMITIEDQEPPFLVNCPSDQTLCNDVDECDKQYFWQIPTPSDNCPRFVMIGNATLADGSVVPANPGMRFPVGQNAVGYVATDASGNTAICGFDITVEDCQMPTIACPADMTVSTTNNCAAQVNWTTPAGDDNCPNWVVSQTAGLSSGSLFAVGAATIAYQVVDASGNMVTCDFTITVVDNGAPVVNCPSDVTLNADQGACTAFYQYVAPNANDNCTGTTTTQTAGLPASGGSYPVGTTTNSYLFTDANGNTVACDFDVTVYDNQMPTIACPGAITLNNDPGLCGAAYVPATPAGADNCPGSVVTQVSGPSNAFLSVGAVNWFEYKVTDASGNMATCRFSVEVLDTEDPTLLPCPTDFTIDSEAGLCGAVATWMVPTGADNCASNVTVNSSHVPGSFFNVGCTPVSYNATDQFGNAAVCAFNVCVEDVESPTVVCPADVTLANDPGICGAVHTYTSVSEGDNCAIVASTVVGLGTGATFPVGTNLETYYVFDAAGNQASCDFNVVVEDREAPKFATCSQALASVSFAPGTGPFISVTNAAPAVATFEVFESFSIGDVNVLNVRGTHTFVSDLDIDLVHPDGTRVTLFSGSCGADDDFDLGFDDASTSAIPCPPVGGGVHTPANALSAFNTKNSAGVWRLEITDFFAGDDGELLGVSVEVLPTTLPSVTVQAAIGACDAVVNYQAPGATDNCPGVGVVLDSGIGSGGTFPIGTNLDVYVATDASGNSAACNFEVIVEDVEDPSITCPADVTANVGVVTVRTPFSLTHIDGPTAARFWGFGAGTRATITVNISNINTNFGDTIEITGVNPHLFAGTHPTIEVWYNTIPFPGANATISTATGWTLHETLTSVTAVTLASPTSLPLSSPIILAPFRTITVAVIADNGVIFGNPGQATPYTPTPTSDGRLIIDGTLSRAGTTNSPGSAVEFLGSVDYLQQDNNANVSCSADVVVGIPAVSDCQTPIVITNDFNNTGDASDTYPAGTTQVTFTATDLSGNDADCTIEVTVIDNVAPTVSCPADMTLVAPVGACDALVNYTVSADDNCSQNLVQTAGQASGTLFPVGTTTNSFVATDPAANSAGCSFNVTVEDNELPTICAAGAPQDIVATANSSASCGAVITFATQVGNDNCPTPVTMLTTSPTPGLNSGSVFPVGVTQAVWTVTDGSGNMATCGFSVTITDEIDPTINCPSDMTYSNDPGVCGATVNYTSPTGADNCPNPSITRTGGLGTGGSFPVGTTLESYRIDDASGNWATCEFNVTVIDTEGPAVTCRNVTFILTPTTPPQSVIPTDVFDGGTDNCGTVIPYAVVPFGRYTCANLGSFPVTLEVRDGSGNSSYCTSTITIDGCNPLPVELLSFTGYNDGPVNVLEWVTAAEYNSAYYVVEKSVNGVDFEPIGTKPAAGTSTSELFYDLVDPNPVNGDNFYRLKQVDLDGEFVYSDVVVINVTWELTISKIIPNPTKGDIDVIFTSGTEGKLTYNMYSMTGQLVKSEVISSTRGTNTIHVDLSNVAQGVYHFSIENGSTTVNKRVIKE